MTGKGYDAFVKAIFGIWAVIIGSIAILVVIIIFAPWLIPILLVPLSIYLFFERRKNFALRAAEEKAASEAKKTDDPSTPSDTSDSDDR
jgi:uncharacterized protein HemY